MLSWLCSRSSKQFLKIGTLIACGFVGVVFLMRFWEPSNTGTFASKRRFSIKKNSEQHRKEPAVAGRQVRTELAAEGPAGLFSDDLRKEPVKLKERLVHLDLKGAPPKVEYFVQLFPLLRSAGATGVLIEYEDMFPYDGELKILRNGYAYGKTDVVKILAAGRSNNLKVVPLVQTFGHMEWVLKHREFAELREVFRYPQVICPSNPRSFQLIKKILNQVVAMHPDVEMFHIGADEAYYIGQECKRCQEEIKKLGKDRLMLNHVSAVARYVREELRIPRVLMWHDMFDETEPRILQEYRMGSLVEPVVWSYRRNLVEEGPFPPDMFQRFRQVFPKLWTGSAFKGANGPAQTFIDIGRYLENNLSWLDVIRINLREGSQFEGIVLTGWQRYDHFGNLCELLPVGIPSLVADLMLVAEGRYRSDLKERIGALLRCPEPVVNLNLPYPVVKEGAVGFGINCDFPGSPVSDLVNELMPVRMAYEGQENSKHLKGWLSAYSLKHKYGSVFFAEKILNHSQALAHNMSVIGTKLRKELQDIFFEDTVTEWLFANVQVYLDKLKELSQSALEIAHTIYFRNRPLDRDKLEF